jgi:hypothetical protein
MMKKFIAFLALGFGLGGQPLAAQSLSNYQAVISSQGPANYFNLDGSLASAVNPEVPLEAFGAGGFTFDVFRNAARSSFFVNQTDFLRNTSDNLISGGGTSNTTSTASGSVTFLFRSLDAGDITGQRYLFSAGGSVSNHNAFALFLENTNVANGDPKSLKLRFGDSTTTILPAADIAPAAWYYFAVTYWESRAPNKAIWYVGRPGRTLLTGVTSNSVESVAGDASGLYLGNRETLDAAFRNPGVGQLDEFAIWDHELSATEVTAQFAALPKRTPPPASAYQYVVAGQSPDYYFQLDGSLSNAVAAGPVLDIAGPSAGFTFDYFGDYLTTNAAAFTAANDALIVSNNLLNAGGTFTGEPGTGSGTISFLFNSLSGTNVSGQRFLFSAGGATATTNAFAVFMENLTSSTDPGAIKVRLGNSSKAILRAQDIAPSEWYYCAVTFDESLTNQQVTWYLGQPGGALIGGTLNYLPGVKAGQGDIFVLGNHTNFNAGWRSPGTGRIDEFAIWHRILTPAEITNQFAGLASVTTVAPPVLTITRSGDDLLLSWPASAPGDLALEMADVLDSTSIGTPGWTSAGTPSLVGSDYVVTNVISAGNRFYRLRSP